jgi:hypothetical protein
MILFLKVHEINIFPKLEGDHIRLGFVSYEKQDFVRGFLVGIAPFSAGLVFFYFVSVFNLFPSINLFQNIILVYLIFSVSSNMFSSKQDLVDFVFVIPLFIFLAGFFYIFQINLDMLFKNKRIWDISLEFLMKMNFYLFLSLIINLSSIIILKSVRFVFRT